MNNKCFSCHTFLFSHLYVWNVILFLGKLDGGGVNWYFCQPSSFLDILGQTEAKPMQYMDYYSAVVKLIVPATAQVGMGRHGLLLSCCHITAPYSLSGSPIEYYGSSYIYTVMGTRSFNCSFSWIHNNAQRSVAYISDFQIATLRTKLNFYRVVLLGKRVINWKKTRQTK